MNTIEQQVAEASLIQQEHDAIDPAKDSGLQALVLAAKTFDISADARQIWHEQGKTDQLFSHIDIIRCAKRIGLKAQVTELTSSQIEKAPLPFIATYKATGTRYLITRISEGQVEFTNPLTGRPARKPIAYLIEHFSCEVVFFAKKPTWKQKSKPFGFSWFIPSIIKHIARFKRVLIASLIIQMFALASPKFFEVVIDKVLVSRGLQSLDVLAIGLLVIAFFEPLMTVVVELTGHFDKGL